MQFIFTSLTHIEHCWLSIGVAALRKSSSQPHRAQSIGMIKWVHRKPKYKQKGVRHVRKGLKSALGLQMKERLVLCCELSGESTQKR